MNPDLFVLTSDWHIRRPGSLPTTWQALVTHIQGLDPVGTIDLGDCKDLFGAETQDDLAEYVTDVGNTLPWATVNSGNALFPALPGNHDEYYDYSEEQPNDLSFWDAELWAEPYNWTCDWAAAQIRFIAYHSTIVHAPSIYKGFFSVAHQERTFVAAELAALPAGWNAIVCSHAPLAPAFGNYIHAVFGGTEMRAVISPYVDQVVCYLNGHRHANASTAVVDGITHINGPSTNYTLGNSYGGFMPITFDSMENTITFDYRLGETPFAQYPGFVPITFSLLEPNNPGGGGGAPPSAGKYAAKRP